MQIQTEFRLLILLVSMHVIQFGKATTNQLLLTMSVKCNRSKKHIVETLCGNSPTVWTKTAAFGNILMYQSICPKESCKEQINYAHKSGYSNPYSHLQPCIGLKNIEQIMVEFEELRKKEMGRQSLITYKPKVDLNDRQRAILSWIN